MHRSLGWTALLALVVALTASLAWWSSPPDRARQEPPDAPMHVSEVMPTDVAFREPVRAFDGDHAYWRVVIRDADERPVADAHVQVDVLAPDGAVRARVASITGSDGLALFTYSLRDATQPGVYTVRVNHVSHAGPRAIAYEPEANTARATSFSVRSPSRR